MVKYNSQNDYLTFEGSFLDELAKGDVLGSACLRLECRLWRLTMIRSAGFVWMSRWLHEFEWVCQILDGAILFVSKPNREQ